MTESKFTWPRRLNSWPRDWRHLEYIGRFAFASDMDLLATNELPIRTLATIMKSGLPHSTRCLKWSEIWITTRNSPVHRMVENEWPHFAPIKLKLSHFIATKVTIESQANSSNADSQSQKIAVGNKSDFCNNVTFVARATLLERESTNESQTAWFILVS